MITDDIDLNVWDQHAWETSGDCVNGWVLVAHAIPYRGSAYGSGEFLGKLALTEHDAKHLGLFDSGEEDFWIDSKGLLAEYGTPRRVVRWIEDKLGELVKYAS